LIALLDSTALMMSAILPSPCFENGAIMGQRQAAVGVRDTAADRGGAGRHARARGEPAYAAPVATGRKRIQTISAPEFSGGCVVCT
jgi:hypothetical protein